jgi:hypothetical protein
VVIFAESGTAVQMKESDLIDALRQADVELKQGQTIQDVSSALRSIITC